MPCVLLRQVVLGSSAEGLSALTGRSHRAQCRDDGGPHAGYSPSRAPTIPGPTSSRHKPQRDCRMIGLVGLGGIGSCADPSGFVGWWLLPTRSLDQPEDHDPGGPRCSPPASARETPPSWRGYWPSCWSPGATTAAASNPASRHPTAHPRP